MYGSAYPNGKVVSLVRSQLTVWALQGHTYWVVSIERCMAMDARLVVSTEVDTSVLTASWLSWGLGLVFGEGEEMWLDKINWALKGGHKLAQCSRTVHTEEHCVWGNEISNEMLARWQVGSPGNKLYIHPCTGTLWQDQLVVPPDNLSKDRLSPSG